MFLHFVELFSAPWEVPFLTLLLKLYWPVQPQPQLIPRFTICQSPVTPEHRRSKGLAVPTTAQLQHVPTFFSAPLLLLSAHMFLKLTTNPPFMCIIGPLAPAGVTALETLSHVVFPIVSPLVCSTFGLFAFVCLFHINCEKTLSEKRSMRRRLMQSHLAKP